MPLPTAYGTIPLGGALPEAYVPGEAIPLLGGALESGYGEVSYAVNMTAAASGSNGITVADDDDIDFGTGDFFLHWEGSLPDWTPSGSEQSLFRKFVNLSTPGIAFQIDDSPSGRIQLAMYNGGGSTTVNASSSVSVGLQDSSAAKITAVVSRESSAASGTIIFYVNGAALGSSVSIPAGSPFTISNAVNAYISGTSSARIASNTISCIVGNFAPTASEVLDLCTNGIPASWKWGSQTAKYASNFSAGADSFTNRFGTTLAGNTDAIGGEDDWLRITVDSTGPARSFRRNLSALIGAVGNRKLTLRMYVPSSNSSLRGLYINWASGATADTSVAAAGTAIPSVDTVTDFSFTSSGASSATQLRFWPVPADGNINSSVSGGDVVYIKLVNVFDLGATMALLPDTIPTSSSTTWSDTSGNTGGGTLPAAGATKVTIRR